MPTLTLAICARNAQDIIGACLESIARQTMAPDRVIVAVDDLSDPTTAVARQWGAEAIASNASGLYEARNAVLEACTSDYLAFTDADCELSREWVERAKRVLDEQPEVGGGTGRHPAIGERNIVSWLHHMWFLVEMRATGETDGVIGGNSYFRVSALRQVGGWLPLERHSAAEDVYISKALARSGWRLWFEEGVAAQHHYETRLRGLWRKSVMMGRDIVVMHRAAGWYDTLFWYTMAIPVACIVFVSGLAATFVAPLTGLMIMMLPLVATLVYLWFQFRSFTKAFPRWVARWVVIWPYSWGIARGLCARLPRLKGANVETDHAG